MPQPRPRAGIKGGFLPIREACKVYCATHEANMMSISHRRGILVRTPVTLGLLHAILSIVCFAQSVGAVISYRKTDHGIEGRTAQGSFAVSVCSEHVVRVQVSR